MENLNEHISLNVRWDVSHCVSVHVNYDVLRKVTDKIKREVKLDRHADGIYLSNVTPMRLQRRQESEIGPLLVLHGCPQYRRDIG